MRFDDPDVAFLEPEGHGQQGLDVVWRLGRSPNGEFPVSFIPGHRVVGFDEGVDHGMEVEGVLTHVIAGLEGLIHVSELEVPGLAHVVPHGGSLVNLRGAVLHGFQRVEDGGEDFVFHLDEAQGLFRHVVVDGRHRRDRFTDIPDPVHGQGRFVHQVGIAPPVAVFNAQSVPWARDDRLDAKEFLRRARVYVEDLGVGMGASEHLAHEHPRQTNIRRVLGGTRYFFHPIDSSYGFAYD